MKFFKKASALAMCACMSISSYSFVMAADTTPKTASVYINGNELDLSGTTPLIKSDRVFVPLRPIFEALGAEVGYEADTKTVTANKEGKHVEFNVGSTEVKVTDNGALNKMTIDAPSFIESSRTYVPVRFAAQALGCNVGWDGTEKAVIIADKEAFIKENGASFDIANKISEFANKAAAEKSKVSGTINFSTTIKDEKDYTLSGKMTINGKADSNNAEINTAIELNEKELKELADKFTAELEGEAKTETEEIFDQLQKSNIDFILDGETLTFYVKSNILSIFTGGPVDTWYKIDISELYSDLGMGNIKDIIKNSQNASIEEQLAECIETIPLNSLEESNVLFETYGSVIKMFSDESFKETADGYVSTLNSSLAEGMELSTTMTATTDSEKNITGFGIDVKALMDGKEVVALNVNTTDKNTTFGLNMTAEDLFTFNANGSVNLEKTTEEISKAPNGNVVNLNNVIPKLISE